MMTAFVVVAIVVYLVVRATWGITKTIFKPITDWIYKLAIDHYKSRGYSEEASKAFVSLIIIGIIALVIVV